MQIKCYLFCVQFPSPCSSFFFSPTYSLSVHSGYSERLRCIRHVCVCVCDHVHVKTLYFFSIHVRFQSSERTLHRHIFLALKKNKRRKKNTLYGGAFFAIYAAWSIFIFIRSTDVCAVYVSALRHGYVAACTVSTSPHERIKMLMPTRSGGVWFGRRPSPNPPEHQQPEGMCDMMMAQGILCDTQPPFRLLLCVCVGTRFAGPN